MGTSEIRALERVRNVEIIKYPREDHYVILRLCEGSLFIKPWRFFTAFRMTLGLLNSKIVLLPRVLRMRCLINIAFFFGIVSLFR